MGIRSPNNNVNSARILKTINIMRPILTRCTKISRENEEHLDSLKTSIIEERF